MRKTPQETEIEFIERHAYDGLLHALTRPGHWTKYFADQNLSSINWKLLLGSIMDKSCSVWSPRASNQLITALDELEIKKSNCPEHAEFAIYSNATAFPIEELSSFKTGSLVSPEESITLIISIEEAGEIAANISGPGIHSEILRNLPNPVSGFWESRNSICQYPLGWDVFFVRKNEVMGIPRSLKIKL